MGAPRVVTLGGGHGQAALLSALSRLECSITAIVSVADDGGCSGRLREELGMAPPGDVRRCLVSLATRHEIALRFEERLSGGGEDGRCIGNLVLAEMAQDLGNLQRAVDWSGVLLGCVGRVVPVAETAGTLSVYDMVHGALLGESHIERTSGSTLVATVDGPELASPLALNAIAKADFVLLGPGSFVGSTLAVLTTGNVAEAISRSPGRRMLIKNIAPEVGTTPMRSVADEDHERVLADHLLIKSGGNATSFDVLRHDSDGTGSKARNDGSFERWAPLARADSRVHDIELFAAALGTHLGLDPATSPLDPSPSEEARAIFDRYLASARLRLFGTNGG
jgi:uncharacterized cofD-like protein